VQKFLTNYAFAFTLQPDYNSRDAILNRNIVLTEELVQKTNSNMFSLFFDVPKYNIPYAVLVLQVTDVRTGQKILHDLLVKFTPERFSDVYAVFNKNGQFPQMKNYFSQQDTLQIANLKGTRRPISVYRYKHQFDPALSPMATSGKNVSKTLEIDTTFTLPSSTMFVLGEPGLYYFREDTNAVNGIGIMVVDHRFPRMTRPEELVKPLIYISTNNEIKELSNTNAPKRTLDTYWLRLANNNEAKARRTIRAYYRRVAQANQLFTTYKEGWKTDMGMVYIIFGKPNKVVRTKDKEVWTFTQNANFSEINFTFVRRPNQFVEDHYELVRYVEYEPIWYPTVEEWRTGIVER
jgi:GWxTD domain-containing protein